jgi:hypothetical protein
MILSNTHSNLTGEIFAMVMPWIAVLRDREGKREKERERERKREKERERERKREKEREREREK